MAPIASCVAIVVSSGSTPFAACMEDNVARMEEGIWCKRWPQAPLRHPVFHKMARLVSRDKGGRQLDAPSTGARRRVASAVGRQRPRGEKGVRRVRQQRTLDGDVRHLVEG
eukprot:scaffold123540_cov36-Phaeocystis_antarctica.AAC.2